MDAPVFTFFPQLPLELRGMIWNEAMPSDGPVMYPFGDHFINYTAQPAGSVAPLMVQLPMPPAFFVCHEAREAARRWMVSVNGWLHFRRETQGHIVVRAWNEESDILYVPRPKWRFFAGDMFDEPPEAGSIYHRMYARVRNLALPAFTAYYSLTGILSVMELARNLTAVHVVWGPVPKVRPSAPGEAVVDAAVQPRWAVEIEDSEEVRMCVTDDGSGTTTWETGELEDWMFELEQELALQEEIPEHYVDDDMGQVTLPFFPREVEEGVEEHGERGRALTASIQRDDRAASRIFTVSARLWDSSGWNPYQYPYYKSFLANVATWFTLGVVEAQGNGVDFHLLLRDGPKGLVFSLAAARKTSFNFFRHGF